MSGYTALTIIACVVSVSIAGICICSIVCDYMLWSETRRRGKDDE